MKNRNVTLLCLVTILLASRCNSVDESHNVPFKPFILKGINEIALSKIPSDVIPGIHADLISKGRNDDAANFLKTYDNVTGEILVPLTIENTNSKSLSSGKSQAGEVLNIRASIQNTGWVTYLNTSYNSAYTNTVIGTTGQSKYMEAFQITSSGGGSGFNPSYEAHVSGIGWQGMKANGQIAGTTGQHRQIEAIRINAENGLSSIYCRYRAHVRNYGWMAWVEDAPLIYTTVPPSQDWAGTTGTGLRLEAFQLELYLYY